MPILQVMHSVKFTSHLCLLAAFLITPVRYLSAENQPHVHLDVFSEKANHPTATQDKDLVQLTNQLRLAVDRAALSLLRERCDADALELVARTTHNLLQSAPTQLSEVFSGWFDCSFSSLTTPSGEDAVRIGKIRGALDFFLFYLVLFHLEKGNLFDVNALRASITIPPNTDGLNGFEAIQSAIHNQSQNTNPAEVLKKEFCLWQAARIRRDVQRLLSTLQNQCVGKTFLNLRVSEILTTEKLLNSLTAYSLEKRENIQISTDFENSNLAAINDPARLEERLRNVVQQLPNLLDEKTAFRRQSLLIKLINLIPLEYHSGVKDGKIILPIEYREAITFTNQSCLLVDELEPWWRTIYGESILVYVQELRSLLSEIASAIHMVQDAQQIHKLATKARSILNERFAQPLHEKGKSYSIINKAAEQVKSLLADCQAAALRKRWREAESLRLEAYTVFDLEIELRTIPRAPTLALRTEKSFLDGADGVPGIKAVLDNKLSQQEIIRSIQHTIALVDECKELLTENLSPVSAVLSAIVIVLREGLEAVVILAALLASLRGNENRIIRKRIWQGVALAVIFSAATFLLGGHIVESFSHHAERLEAVISVLAVAVLLVVTNWVLHKYYWTGWNAKLRELSAICRSKKSPFFRTLALVGVGFLTIYREGFETTLFLQSLILESSLQHTLVGAFAGLAAVLAIGIAIFLFSAKLPYRKMLVFTGVLVVGILFSFTGSTTRLLQTAGWLTVHPIVGVEFPGWVGPWLGLYPTWEGVLIPLASMFYVFAAWFTVKILSRSKKITSKHMIQDRAENLTNSQMLPYFTK